MLISENYLSTLKKLHETDENWGSSANKWLHRVLQFAKEYNCNSILDYGCGKAVLEEVLSKDFLYQAYDPAVKNRKAKSPQDMVICIDVLEHIEADFLDNVLADIKSHAKKSVLFVVSTRAAATILPDGRNAHLIIETSTWWREKLSQFFSEKYFSTTGSEIIWVGV
jgi:2-polyprenyl-3-methyl-5-hydroxy-6-metoxy-1,4-benzoquinol methylase